jgi:hypothetical protein
MAEYKDVPIPDLQRMARQRLRDDPELSAPDFESLAPMEELEWLKPEYYRRQMIWIITAPAEELLDAMQGGSWAETVKSLDEWLAQRE